jgi:hypothetical protein
MTNEMEVAGHVARMVEERNTWTVFWVNLKETTRKK